MHGSNSELPQRGAYLHAFPPHPHSKKKLTHLLLARANGCLFVFVLKVVLQFCGGSRNSGGQSVVGDLTTPSSFVCVCVWWGGSNFFKSLCVGIDVRFP